MLPKPGDLLGGKYRIVRLIGDGGMGSVYEARHEGLGTGVALKVLHEDLAERPGLTERFLREARVAATIQSPHVARVTDVDRGPDGVPFLVMELLSGESLQHLLDRELKLRSEVAVDFALQIAAGLEAAHALGVVHRDMKPDNVFVTPGSTGPVLKLIDFGIAKLLSGPEGRGLTRTGVVLGTAEYMPPEQLYAASDVDGRTDVYALGVMLFEMLSGRRPADGDDAQEIVGKVLSGDVLSLATLEPGLSPELVALVRRATAGDRDARIRSASEFRTLLAPHAHAPSAAGAIAARATPLEPAGGAAPKTLAPEEREAFAKGSTEAASPLGVARSDAPPPWRPSAPSATPRAPARRGGTGWLVVLVLVLTAGAGAAGFVIWSRQGGPLPPPPVEANLPTPSEAFTAQGQATSLVPTALPPHPAAPTPSPRDPNRPDPSPTPSAAVTADAGLFPVPLQLPSTFPPLPFPSTLPSVFPTAFPSVLPTGFPALPSSFPGFPGSQQPSPDKNGGKPQPN
jgi:eukaryotic-like serine/threonine-protein kinase